MAFWCQRGLCFSIDAHSFSRAPISIKIYDYGHQFRQSYTPTTALTGLRVVAPEPNTWRELLAVTENRIERRIALQEYGRSNPDLIQGFRARGADVTPVRVYQYGLPEDVEPLREAARRLAAGTFDVVFFTTGVQIEHLAQ